LAYNNISFSPDEFADSTIGGADTSFSIGGLVFTVIAHGNWSADFTGERFNFVEDPAFGLTQFVVRVTAQNGGRFRFNDVTAEYQGGPAQDVFLAIGNVTVGDVDFAGTLRYGTWGPASAFEYSVNIRDIGYMPSSPNPTSSFWLDNLSVEIIPPNPVVTSIIRDDAVLVPASATTSTYTVTFSSAVSGVTTDDFTLVGTGSAQGSVTAVSGVGSTYTITVNDIAGDGTLRLDFNASGTGVVDTFGNPVGGGFTAGQTYTIDRTAPNSIVDSLILSADSGASGTDFITNVAAQTISGILSAPLAAGESVQISLDNGGSWTTAAADGTSFSASLTLPGSNTLQVRVVDAAGNAGTPLSQAYVLDTSAPVLAITSNVPALKAGDTATVTFTFSEDPGASFTWNGVAGDVVVSGGTLSAISGTGLTRTATFTPDANVNSGTASISVAAGSYADAAGNIGGAGATPSLSFDTLAPSAPSAPDLAAGSDSGASNSDNITNVAAPTFTGTAESGATVRLYNIDGTLLGSTVASGGNWEITTSTLEPGAQSLFATATDQAGNVSATSSALSVMIDRTPPTLAITSNVAALKAGQTATVTFTFSEDPGASFTWDGNVGDIMVSGGALSAISGTGLTRTAIFTPDANVNGITASISVPAGSYADAAGNGGGAGAPPSLTFDTLAPNAPTVPDLAVGSDTGTSDTDNITNIATPTFSGVAESGATVRLFGTDGALLGTTVAVNGTWSITASALTDGTHTVVARATDSAGNESQASAGQTVTIDTTAPRAPTLTLNPTSDTGSSNSDGITSDTTLTVDGTAAADAMVSIYDRTTLLGTAQANGQGVFSFTTPALTGAPSLVAEVRDAAGNSARSLPLNVNIDTSAPASTVASVALSSDTGASTDDFVTKTAAQTVTGTLSAPLAAGDTVQISLDNGASWTSAAASGQNFSTPVTLAGSNTLQVRVVDAAGNAGTPLTQAYVLDTSAPTITISSDAAALKAGETATVTFTFSEDPGASFTWDGTVGDVVVSGGTLSAISGSGLTRAAIFTPEANVQNGAASITVSAGSYADVADNLGGAGATPSLSFDTRAPNAPSGPHLAAGSDSGASNGDNVTNIVTPTFTGTAESGSTVRIYGGDGTLLGTTEAVDGAWAVTSTNLADGGHTITAEATDLAGNVGPRSGALKVTIDSASPSEPVITLSDNALTASDTSTVRIRFAEAVTGLTLDNLTAENATLTNLRSTNGGLTWTAVLTPNSNVKGTSNLVVLNLAGVNDIAGNAANGVYQSPIYAVDTTVADNGGADFIVGGPGADSVSGGLDNDTISGGGGNDTVFGNQGQDLLYGGAGSDEIYGGQDNDTIYGGSSDVDGADAADLLYGNKGNDLVYGNGGNDTLFGGEGSDTLCGGHGDDAIYGGDADVSTTDDSDLIYGGFGNDTIYGNAGEDSLFGNQNDDLIFGGQGNDFIHGGQGDDTLVGGVGNDTLIGGLGADLLVFAPGGGNDRIEGFDHGDGDRLDLGGQSFLAAYVGGDLVLSLGDGGTITLVGIEAESPLF
jgi:Ca2+-binding RTX toxin-like protein